MVNDLQHGLTKIVSMCVVVSGILHLLGIFYVPKLYRLKQIPISCLGVQLSKQVLYVHQTIISVIGQF